MKDKDKMIGGIPLSKWKEAFHELCQIAMDKDYFSDILFFDLYPNTHEEADKIEDEDAQYAFYNEKWEYAYKALKEVFEERE